MGQSREKISAGRKRHLVTERLVASGVLAATAILLAGVVQAAPVDSTGVQARCKALTRLPIEGGRVEAARVVAAGFEASPSTASAGVPGFTLPQSCRVNLLLTPAPGSHIRTEVWLPARTWNGRLQGVDNGGFGGSINIREMMVALKYGYAVASTDTGHEAPETDASWALGHPQEVVDASWRAIHETAVVAKRVIRAFYGRASRHSYFSGGSNGGRQALIEAERFPDDYDGIVAGAPALDPANNLTTGAWIAHLVLKNPANFIPASEAPLIAAAVMKQCGDRIDGLADGVVGDPTACQFNPRVLACRRGQRQHCLTAPQVQWLKDIYNGPDGSYDGHRNWGYEPGGEAGWAGFWFAKAPAQMLAPVFSVAYFRYFVYSNPKWDLARFSYEKDRAAAARVTREDAFEADDPDLAGFRAHGGKLILYQGWADPLVPPRITVDYFTSIQARMGVGATAGFVRLYMVPGMGHVIGGAGPNVFGQLTPGAASDPRHSVTAAVQQWVEQGIAPRAIIAGQYANDIKALLAPGSVRPLRERPLCPYPEVARWKGHGSITDAENFACVGGRD